MAENEKQHYLDPEVEKNLPPPLADAIRRGSVPEDVLKHSHDADEAMKAFAGHEGQIIELDAATNKRILRRIDWNLIPVREALIFDDARDSAHKVYRSCASSTAATSSTRPPSRMPASWAWKMTSG